MRYLQRVITTLTLGCITSATSFAQDDVDKFLSGSIGDARKLTEAYIGPFMRSVSSGLNQGWYNTAKPHKVAGFDLTFTVSAMSIPTDEMFYEPGKLGLTYVELDATSPDRPNAPTIFGPERAPVFRVVDGADEGEVFEGPPGIDLNKNIGKNWMPVPMVQFSFGLPKGTEIKFRFSPTVKVGDESDFSMFGIGVMHDVKQWIPGMKTLPFDLSALAGYSKLKFTTRLEEQNSENPTGLMEMSSFTIQGIISKKISVLTVYGALGYNMANSKMAVLGSYDLNGDSDYNDADEVDPIKLNFEASGARMTAGFRLKLAVITLHADYTLQEYDAITVGLGINVR